MIRKIILMVVLAFMFFSFLIGSAEAIGVTPGRASLSFESGKEVPIVFTIVNTEKRDISLVVLVQGEFNQSIRMKEVSFKMSKDENEKRIQASFKMPDSLSPGNHMSEIVIVQLPESNGGDTVIGASVAVATQVHVAVPYPNKYAEASLNVVTSESPKIVFVVPVINLGKLGIERVKANIDIYGSLNEKITSFNTNEVSLKSGERREVSYTWNANVTPGIYRAVATLLYDEETFKMERQFAVGNPVLDLQQIEVNDFSLGEIAKFEMLIENRWSEPVTGAYAEMQIFNDDKEVMADFKSATYDFQPLSKKTVVAFWDTEGVSKGEYDSSVFLRYGQHSSQKDFQLKVDENSITAIGIGYVISDKGSKSGGSNLTTILIVAVIVLILINLVWFLALRKMIKKKS